MLTGKRALITGSTGGLGLAIADGLARAGCDVILHGLEDDSIGDECCRKLTTDRPIAARYIRADLANEVGIQHLVEFAVDNDTGVDILVNNAVVRHFAPLESFPTAAWERALAVNVSAAFHLVRTALPGMRTRGWGRIINMSSVYGLRGTTNRIDYVTTKTALIGLTRAVAMETVGQGITCNAVCPGSVLTPAIDARVQRLVAETGKTRHEAEREFLAGKQPTGSFIAAEHVADLIVFLCTPSARDVTGAVLPVEGGWLAS